MSPFEYLNQVCGVEEIVMPSKPSTVAISESTGVDSSNRSGVPNVHEAADAKIVFVSAETRSEYRSTYQAMFEKMVSAMGLDLSDVHLVLNGEESWPQSQTKVRIYLGSAKEPDGWKESSSTRELVVPSLVQMSQDPEYKKIAWQYLKKEEFQRYV